MFSTDFDKNEEVINSTTVLLFFCILSRNFSANYELIF